MASASPRRLETQLKEWVESLKDERAGRRKKYVFAQQIERLAKLCSKRSVTTRLAKILKDEAHAVEMSQNFLLAVSDEAGPDLSSANIPRSIQRRKLAQLAKATRKLARRIPLYGRSGVIIEGTDSLSFLTERLHPMALEDISEVHDNYDYDDDGNPLPVDTLSDLMETFASTLDFQAELLYGGPRKRSTGLNEYADLLAKLSGEHLRRVDPILIDYIVYFVTETTFSHDAIRKRHRNKPTS